MTVHELNFMILTQLAKAAICFTGVGLIWVLWRYVYDPLDRSLSGKGDPSPLLRRYLLRWTVSLSALVVGLVIWLIWSF